MVLGPGGGGVIVGFVLCRTCGDVNAKRYPKPTRKKRNESFKNFISDFQGTIILGIVS